MAQAPGTLSWDEFKRQASELALALARHGDCSWRWIDRSTIAGAVGAARGYLCRGPCPVSPTSSLVVEHHVLWSPSYAVPVMYLAVWREESSESCVKPLVPAEAIRELCPGIADARARAHGSTITQCEHPVTGMPFLCLHPCGTAELMAGVVQEAPGGRDAYLQAWLSWAAAATGIRLDPSAFAQGDRC
eukprot:m51a1_g3329 hypothetical protein (189) ;mRNA; r:369391-369957